MKAFHQISAAAIVVLTFSFGQSQAQTMSLPPGDTINIVAYNSDVNFDAKRTVVFSDKHSVDSLVSVLAAGDHKNYRVVYRREGVEGKVVSRKEFSKIDKGSIYRIMIAYNKKGLPDDDKPIYVLTAK